MKTISFLFVLYAFLFSSCRSEHNFDATGTFETTEIIVSSESNGKLFYLNAEEGNRLKRGEEVGKNAPVPRI